MKYVVEFIVGAAIAGLSIIAAILVSGGRVDW